MQENENTESKASKKSTLVPKLLLLAGLVGLITLVISKGWHHYLTLDQLKASRDGLVAYADQHRLLALAFFMLLYVAVTALSIPGAAILTLAAGAIFGRWWGTGAVSIASTVGATLAMLVARYVLRESVQSRFAERLKAFNAGVEKEGAFYLFALRLIPAVPFFVINLAMGLTKIRVSTYFLVSMVGMLPGTFVFVNAGTELAHINSLGDILSPGLIGAFVALGLLPIVLKQLMKRIRPE